MQWGQKEEPECKRGDLKLRGVTLGTSLEIIRTKTLCLLFFVAIQV
jgi:hypothetical protein